MKRLWLYLVGLLMLAACSDDVPEVPEPQVKGRTMLAYLVANNRFGDLDPYLKYNVVDMYKGMSESRDSMVLLVYYRPKPSDKSLDGPSFLKFVADGKGRINGKKTIPASELKIDDRFNNASEVANRVFQQAEITNAGSINDVATDPDIMVANLKKMTQMVPSTSYGLTMGSHGTGWLEAPNTKARSFGDDSGISINIPELAGVLKDAFAQKTLDFVLFDACMMANAEVAYELRDVTNYVIASVLETPVYGFPYVRFFDELYEDKMDFQEICDEFIEFSKLQDVWGTCAVVDCKQMQALADWVKTGLAANASELTEDFPTKVIQYGRRTAGFGDFSYDVVDVFRQLRGQEPTDLKQLMDKVVIAKSCIESDGKDFPYVEIDKDRFCGIGMYLPYMVEEPEWDAYYMNSFAWPKAIDWNYNLNNN